MKNKKEIEEAAKRYANKIWDSSNSNEKTLHTNCNKAFLKGAKWQQDKMYSEEDMTNYALYILHNDVITPKEWFKQFKNK